MKPFVTFSRRFIIGLFAFLMLTFLVTSFLSTARITQQETMDYGWDAWWLHALVLTVAGGLLWLLAPKLEQAGVLRVTWRVHPPENQRKSATEACALGAAIPHCVRGSLLLVTWHHHRMPSATRRLSGKGRCVLSGRELARGL